MVHILQNDKNNRHAHNDDTVELSHTICIEPLSEEEVQEDFDSVDPAAVAWNFAGIEHRHEICHQPLPNSKQGSSRKKAPKRNQLSLTHLRCCRQMYLEARSVHYTNNTFAIFCNDILERFAKSRFQNQQHLAIRSLFLDVSIIHLSNVDAWSASISRAVLRRLKSVRYLHLNLLQLYCDCTTDVCGYQGSEMTFRQVKMFKKLRKLPLKMATMTIDDSELGVSDSDTTDQRWTMREKQEFSRQIREVLLA